jgi:hypothetical protein
MVAQATSGSQKNSCSVLVIIFLIQIKLATGHSLWHFFSVPQAGGVARF